MEHRFIIHGEPEGKARPRVTSHGTYTPRQTRDYERLVRWEYKTQGGPDFGRRPLSVTIVARFPIPKKATKRDRAKMLAGYMVPTKKPDADNIAKAVCDALNGIAYQDDAQIVNLVVRKNYTSADPCVYVYLVEWEELLDV